MAYIPPHKRLSKDERAPTPTPMPINPQVKKNLNPRLFASSFDRRKDKQSSWGQKIIYADHSRSRWLAVPLTSDDQPSSLYLEPVSLEAVERRTGHRPLALVTKRSDQGSHRHENTNARQCNMDFPWVSLAGTVHADLVSASRHVRNDMEDQRLEEVKPTLVARFGKVVFLESTTINVASFRDSPVSENVLNCLRRLFYTNVPELYAQYVRAAVTQKLGVDFEEEKEIYHVKIADSVHPDRTLSCKCRVNKDEKKLQLYKIELNQVRHLVVDASCLDAKVDLRLMLCRKRIVTAISDEERQYINELISFAILDMNVKGGLRWPLGKENSGGRYSVVGVWHTKAESYSNSSMRLKVREADRFDFITSLGEVTREISLKLKALGSYLLGQNIERTEGLIMLTGALALIWDSFLSWDDPSGLLSSYPA